MRQDVPTPEAPARRLSVFAVRRAALARAGIAVLALGAAAALSLSNDTKRGEDLAEASTPRDQLAALEADAPPGLSALDTAALDALRGAYREATAPAPTEAPAETPATVEPATPFVEQAPVAPPEPQVTESQPVEAAPAQIVPLPIQRPPEFRRQAGQDAPRAGDRRSPRRASVASAAPVAKEDDRNFFEKFFGIERPTSPALAYAALETPSVDRLPRQKLVPAPAPGSGGGVAVYDISARTVTLPSGERLEAHSGLGSNMDDPRFVNQRMSGPTPPGTYDLTEREQIFHGVRAIRLTPVGGAEAIYGRNGLLAHTYMLGPSGQSNGCVAFRDYNKFLQAFLRGEIARLVVVPGRSDGVPALASQPSKAPTRTARAGNDA